jgi:hypothetical protein
MAKVQKQINISPNTATFEKSEKGTHYGFCFCPFCNSQIVSHGINGLAYLSETCDHVQGIAMGVNLGDITVLVKG